MIDKDIMREAAEILESDSVDTLELLAVLLVHPEKLPELFEDQMKKLGADADLVFETAHMVGSMVRNPTTAFMQGFSLGVVCGRIDENRSDPRND